jgi:hypothetical protein
LKVGGDWRKGGRGKGKGKGGIEGRKGLKEGRD